MAKPEPQEGASLPQIAEPAKPADDEDAHAMRPMPTDFTISLGAKGGIDRQLFSPGTERRQSMRGFEDGYVDIIDYIVRITHRIWEEKDIGYIYDTYSYSSKVYDDHGLQYGRDKIVADTVHTVNAFPDVRLFADEIIWSGNDEVGFSTSHRTLITGHNTGPSRYGPPTGRKVVLWCVANCVALANEIFAEWVVYDTAGLIRQLGFDLRDKAKEFGNQVDWSELSVGPASEPERLPGQGKPVYRPYGGDGFDPEEFVRATYHNIWNRRMVGTVRQAYAPSLRFRGSTGRSFNGQGKYQAFVLSLLALFPDLALRVDDVYWMGNDREGYLTSVRWSISGTHRGFGVYGPPTGRQVSMWGISQHRIRDGVIHEEWTLFNEFGVMQQLYRD